MVNSILDSGEMAIIGIVLCGMLVLAAIMLPKIMRYRKRMKAKQEAKPDDAEIFVAQENDTEETAANK